MRNNYCCPGLGLATSYSESPRVWRALNFPSLIYDIFPRLTALLMHPFSYIYDIYTHIPKMYDTVYLDRLIWILCTYVCCSLQGLRNRRKNSCLCFWLYIVYGECVYRRDVIRIFCHLHFWNYWNARMLEPNIKTRIYVHSFFFLKTCLICFCYACTLLRGTKKRSKFPVVTFVSWRACLCFDILSNAIYIHARMGERSFWDFIFFLLHKKNISHT